MSDSLVLNAIFENAVNDINNKARGDTSEKELCLSSENERNKKSKAIGVISKPEFLETFEKSIKGFRI